jgi:hypothetical protein
MEVCTFETPPLDTPAHYTEMETRDLQVVTTPQLLETVVIKITEISETEIL